MQILAVIEIDENYQFTEVNNLYDRLHDYKVKLVPVPHYFTDDEIMMANEKKAIEMRAYNDCLDEIIGAEE